MEQFEIAGRKYAKGLRMREDRSLASVKLLVLCSTCEGVGLLSLSLLNEISGEEVES